VGFHNGAILQGDGLPALENGEHLPPGDPQLHGFVWQKPARDLGQFTHVAGCRQLLRSGVADLPVDREASCPAVRLTYNL